MAKHLSDSSVNSVHRLTRIKLTLQAELAISSAAELIVLKYKETLFYNICYSLATRGYNNNPAFVLCVYIGDVLFGPTPAPCLDSLYRSNTTLLPECWMTDVAL